ncbi:MAG: hypothetical protein KAR39_13360 [Thermoplasmata archaeon]|nr:hypothetical protein [Thermoplasmata archaeon]
MRIYVYKKAGKGRDVLFRPAKATRMPMALLQGVEDSDLEAAVLAEQVAYDSLRPQWKELF